VSRSVVNHHDGSRTVTFADGHKATFGAPRAKKAVITGTPYVFAKGPKIALPEGIAHGMIFEQGRKMYVALRYHGRDAIGRKVGACYGQPITLTRPL
jgi:prepilin-type processing-associated H-X9-DG protein